MGRLSIGAEGIKGELAWNGFISDDPEEIAQMAYRLYTNQADWSKAQLNGIKLLNSNFNGEQYKKEFQISINEMADKLSQHRGKNFIGSLLEHHTLQSTKYLSKWIELKNSNAQ